MAEIIPFTPPVRPVPRLISGNSDELALAILQAEHNLVVDALENIAAANLELSALSRLAVKGDTDRVGDLINDEILISLGNAMVHLIAARGNLTGHQQARIALLAMIDAMEGAAHG